MKKIFQLLLTPLIAGFLSVQVANAAESSAKIIEIVTFKLKPGVSAEEFRKIDKDVEVSHVSKQPGFVSRESAADENGNWLVIVHWRSTQDADASMASFEKAPAAANFMARLDASTMSMRRYKAL